ncbi:hypothetical protein KAFR_0B05350 [Kazachstania africana CBS 2517]|uniref:Membrane protein TMS1 n=1 Tax=Kazachstania africana (strain ATCC 22294 / BCRC 22015 / CBS 2517 / CECT 1963 / NBRC 1671 / NRRL Y-8276) TaxID=1071382 RepID=H2AR30_KAZAF|nr:hypothetical protein KAFR_0B05350 [Kazachstania africana CBS 2517]CCF56830.1 hypothetical protein KAFR_0B05350 [Kazachstania africana CBS 2517]
MGAIISIPITMGTTFVASCMGGCFSSLISKTMTSMASSSLGTRLLYAAALLLNSLISWVTMSTNKALLWPDKSCTETGECGFFTVHRLNFALGLLHLFLAAVMIGVKSTKDQRAALQNSWWGLKFFVYIILVIFSFFISNNFFVFISKWVSVPSGGIFILVGLILLVDFSHEWAETCIYHVELEDEHSDLWQRFLVIGTAGMYTGSIIMTAVMFIVFCKDQCNMNQSAVTINLILSLITTFLSVSPKIQRANPKSGLAQSSMVSVYCTYLTMSAMASEPDDKLCNPLVRSNSTRNASVILGSLFTFIAIAYTTTRAASNSAFQGTNRNGEIFLGDDVEYEGLEGQTRRQMRYEAIKQAVEEGSLPESALHDVTWMSEPTISSTNHIANDDEYSGTTYNYTLFHLIFFLATQWIASLLTVNVVKDDVGNFIPVGRTYFYSWVKIASSWICYALFDWTLLAPVVLEGYGYEDYY